MYFVNFKNEAWQAVYFAADFMAFHMHHIFTSGITGAFFLKFLNFYKKCAKFIIL